MDAPDGPLLAQLGLCPALYVYHDFDSQIRREELSGANRGWEKEMSNDGKFAPQKKLYVYLNCCISPPIVSTETNLTAIFANENNKEQKSIKKKKLSQPE